MYNPTTGRFLQRDPVGYPNGMNAYAAYHLMLGSTDPSGLDRTDELSPRDDSNVKPYVFEGEFKDDEDDPRIERRRLQPIEQPGEDIELTGTVVKDSASSDQNCAGKSSCNAGKWINWPMSGDYPTGEATEKMFLDATNFIPTGCQRVYRAVFGGGAVNNPNSTYCQDGEREIIVYVSKVAIGKNTSIGFHMLGRTIQNGQASLWETKIDAREEIKDIYIPQRHMNDFYAWRLNAAANDKTFTLIFCCDCEKMVFSEQ